tara:strand:- start:2124 stop:2870 length:747 start_codon:yes stop_codon:yes gene_type:complete
MAHGPYVVTGASKGIGREIALLLAAQGYPVIGLARPSDKLNEIGELLAASCPGSFSLACDLSLSNDIQAAAEQIGEQFGWVAGIVHNAGTIFPINSIADSDMDEWKHSLQANLIGVQDLTQRLIPLLGGAKQSRVTTISSGASLRPVESWSAYCVSKAGLDMWAKCLAAEGAHANISAISIAPGVVDTGMQLDIRSAAPENFPSHADFVALHTEGHLTQSQDVAAQLCPLILHHSMEQSGQRFDVREL